MKNWRLLFAAICFCVCGVSEAAEVNSLLIAPGTNSQFSSQIRLAPGWIDARVLAANIAESHTVPTVAKWVLFSGTCNFYANPFRAATVPSGDVTDGTAGELNPAGYLLNGVTAISLIAPTACIVTMSFYN